MRDRQNRLSKREKQERMISFKFSKALCARERLEAFWKIEDFFFSFHLFSRARIFPRKERKMWKGTRGVWPARARCNEISHVSISERDHYEWFPFFFISFFGNHSKILDKKISQLLPNKLKQKYNLSFDSCFWNKQMIFRLKLI